MIFLFNSGTRLREVPRDPYNIDEAPGILLTLFLSPLRYKDFAYIIFLVPTHRWFISFTSMLFVSSILCIVVIGLFDQAISL